MQRTEIIKEEDLCRPPQAEGNLQTFRGSLLFIDFNHGFIHGFNLPAVQSHDISLFLAYHTGAERGHFSLLSLTPQGEPVMANEERLDDLDQQPAAADESGQGFDDPALPELGEKSSDLDSSVCGCFSEICGGVFPSPSGIPDTPFVLRNLKLQALPEL